MKRLGALDKAFLLAESRETPMHVGGLSLYTLPEGADEQAFLASLADNMRDARELLAIPRAGHHPRHSPTSRRWSTPWERWTRAAGHRPA